MIGKKLGRYEIRAKLGSGGMGEVYEAYDSLLERAVAVKILSADFCCDKVWTARFYREARAASALNHPHILTIYEIGETEYGTFLATELVNGETLRELIKRGPAATIQVLKIAEQIASALSAAHEANIVHRDVKPENVMVRRDGYVKVLDFGLAKQIVPDNAEDSTVKTMAGMILGSVKYMSPEQARAQRVDARTDIWSFGVVLYEMLACKGPFDKQTTSETLGAIIYTSPDQIADANSNVPAEVQAIISTCLEKNPDDRFQTMAEVGREIRDVLYAFEHAASAERRGFTTGDVQYDPGENPTIIHQSTTSDRHHNSAARTARSREAALTRALWRRPWPITAAVALAVLIVGALVAYALLHRPRRAMINKFEKLVVARLNSDGKAVLPALSPDGKYVAYAKGEAGNRSIVVRQLATNSEVIVVPPTAQGFPTITFSPSSDYVLYTETTKDYNLNNLFQVPTLGGESKQLIRDIDSAPTFSPDGKRLAFMRHAGDKGTDIIFTAAADGSNLTEILNRQKTEYSFLTMPAWTPQGDTILVAGGKTQGGTTTGIVMLEVKADGSSFKVFNPKSWRNLESMAWLRDGSGFLLIARENDSSTNQLWRIAYPSGTAQAITNDLNDYTGLSVSADGATIITSKADTVSSLWTYAPQEKAIVQLSPDSPTLDGSNGINLATDGHLLFTRREGRLIDIWVADADGKNPRRLTSEARSNFSPLMTPNGHYIIFNSNRSGSYRIWRMDADGKNAVQLTPDDVDTSDYNPMVTPDGQSVLFNRNYASDVQPSEIRRVSINDKSVSTVLKIPQHSVFQPQISPDGKHMLYTSYAAESIIRTLYVASFDGSVAGATEKSAPYSLMNIVKWSPDGKVLTYVNAEGIQNIWQMLPDGTQKKPITDFKSGRIFNYTWSGNGKTLFIVRAIVNNDLVMIRDADSSPTP